MNKILKEKGNSTICPITLVVKDNKILMGCRHYSKDNVVWTLPGGRCEQNEIIEEALRREVFEEVGIKDLDILDFIAEVPGSTPGDSVPIFFSKTNEEAKLMEPEKFSAWEWVTKDEYISGKNYGGFNPLARHLVVEYIKINM